MSSFKYKKQLLVELMASDYETGETSSQEPFKTEVRERREVEDIRRLEGRLRALEEESEMLKEELLESVEERTKLVTEIYEHFDIIRHCLVQREVERGDQLQSNNGNMMVSFLKVKRAGLLHVLYQESNPWLVNRGLKANVPG